MPKKQDPRAIAMSYFAVAPIESIEADLSLIRQIVNARKRQVPPRLQGTSVTAALPARRRIRPPATHEEDVPLPGIQAQVGE